MRELEPVANHGSAYAGNYSAEQNLNFSVAFGNITEAFKQAQLSGLSATDEHVQTLVRKHYEFCAQFWTPSRATYKSLAKSYLLPTPYRDSYESVNSGLAKFHHDAIVYWADANLD